MHSVCFSIIIPTYNSSKFIKNILDSIPSRKDVEVIIVDDHSRDFIKLEEMINNYASVRLMRNTKAQGAGNARQVGLECAQGRWVLFGDSDDRFTPNLNEVLDAYANCVADVVLFIPKAIKLDGHRSSRCDYYHYLFNQYINEKISAFELSYRLTSVWSKLYRRETIACARFGNTLVADDVQFAAQAAFYTRKKIMVDKYNPIYILTERAGSVTKTRHRKVSKILARTKIRTMNDGWIQTQLRNAGEDCIDIRRYESVLRRLFLSSSYNEEERARWALNPIKTILRVISIARKAIFAISARPFLYKIKKTAPVKLGEVDIAYCVDNNVVKQSLVSVVSVLRNNTIRQLNVHYVYTKLSSQNLNSMHAFEQKHSNLKIVLHEVNDKRLESLFSRKYTKITPVGYGRFLFAEALPELEKVLYIDTDIVCVGDFSHLWNLNINNMFAAAVPEYPSWYSTGLTRNQEKARLFIARENEMVNSGVMLFNLEYIRKENIVDKLFMADKLIINRMNQDQDIYNVVFEGKMKMLPVTYNMTALNYTQNLTKIFNAVFIHYTGPNKPWNKKVGIKRLMALFDVRLPYYKKYERDLEDEK